MWNAVSKIDSLGPLRKVKPVKNDDDSEDEKPKFASPVKRSPPPIPVKMQHKRSLSNLMDACKDFGKNKGRGMPEKSVK